MRLLALAILAGLLGSPALRAQVTNATLSSPNGRLRLTISTAGSDQGAKRLVYFISYRGRPLITASALRLDLENQSPLGPGMGIVRSTESKRDLQYRLIAGKSSLVHDVCNELRLECEEKKAPQRKLGIEARAYNDAVAFRYMVPAQPGISEFRLARERTEFRLSKDATTYSLVLPHYRSMYESEFIKLPATAFGNQGGVRSEALIGLPMLLHVPGVAWMAIMDADLQDYAAMYLSNIGGGWSASGFESRLAPQLSNTNVCVTGALPHRSAWRVLLVSETPGGLIESDVITSLNPPCAIEDTSWIRPGKAAWDWWSGSIDAGGQRSFTTENMKSYVDFAAASKLEYMLVDAGWAARGDITRMNGRVDIPELVRYAAPKGVKIWIWLGYRETGRQMEEAFALYEKWGVAGVKIDFIERDDQEGIAFYYRAAEQGARRHLMVDFHGSTKPTGLERTWPNVMGYEAVCGMEQSKGGGRDNPGLRVTLPFTRMLAGPMDYTPGGFRNVTREAFEGRSTLPLVMGTRAQQLAMYVVYQSPFQMVSDCPSAYQDQREFKFIEDVPASWDETRVLAGEPGEFIVMARRRGDDWYIGAMNNWRARELELPLVMLGDGAYKAEIYADAADAASKPTHVVMETKSVRKKSKLMARLAPGGGYAVRIVRRD